MFFACKYGRILRNSNFNALTLSFKNVVTAGRLKFCETRKNICGIKGKNVVASGHMPPPAHLIVYIRNKNKKHSTVINKNKKHSTVINKNQSLFFFQTQNSRYAYRLMA